MRIFGLIGYPLSHSFSSGFFAKKFSNENITDALYQNFPLTSINLLPDLIKSHPDLVGLNVTIPYKQQVIPYLSVLDETAKNVGAVNTIHIEKSNDAISLMGFNTDVYGFEESLKPQLRPSQTSALVLGTGGASKAVIYVLKKLGITCHLISRNSAEEVYKTYQELTEKDIEEHQIIINTTPLGMFPNLHQLPDMPYEALTSDHLLYDLIYNPLRTAFLEEGVKKGATTMNGLEMLHLQALKAWDIWNQK